MMAIREGRSTSPERERSGFAGLAPEGSARGEDLEGEAALVEADAGVVLGVAQPLHVVHVDAWLAEREKAPVPHHAVQDERVERSQQERPHDVEVGAVVEARTAGATAITAGQLSTSRAWVWVTWWNIIWQSRPESVAGASFRS